MEWLWWKSRVGSKWEFASEAILVVIEWEVVESGFFQLPAYSVNREVILVSSPPESVGILGIW